ncbi:MAG TPA: phosphoglycerate mutase family protein [Pyrinomonadaceae bacterium]|nr:phosphoglycerate mutase family protein [Pyrinomonadaceae bacterium]
MTTLALARRSWSALVLLLVSAVACAGQASDAKPAPADAPGGRVTTVFLVRHAERAREPAQDPPLTDAGKARAEALARLLSGAGVKAVYTSQFARTKQTAEPLAKLLGVPASVVALSLKPDKPREVSEQSIRELKSKVEAHAGEAVLVVGHTNSVPDLIRELGGDVVPTIEESKFDDLFVVTVYAPGRAKVVHLKYGAP